jgi:tetrahydromethanopterin S-methyltransferase subunit G
MIMAVMVRETWTDERLDDLSKKVDDGFADLKAEMRERFDRLEAQFDRVDKRFEQVDKRFEAMDARFDSLSRNLLQVAGMIIAAVIGLLATQL